MRISWYYGDNTYDTPMRKSMVFFFIGSVSQNNYNGDIMSYHGDNHSNIINSIDNTGMIISNIMGTIIIL